MQYDDDIAFQRAILANPSDTTLKLVYADWLQDRGDPRAEYIRLELERARCADDAYGPWEQVEQLHRLAQELDPTWIAFMSSLARPFKPYGFVDGHPFTDRLGIRGKVCVLESQYHTPDAWSVGLLLDLAFLTSVGWGVCYYGHDDPPLYGFLCDLPNGQQSLTASAVLSAITAAASSWPEGIPSAEQCRIHTRFGEQPLFCHDADGDERVSAHGRLRAHLDEGEIWYVLLRTDAGIDGAAPDDLFDTLCLAVGRSPHGNRLVGCLTCQQLQIW